MDENRQRNIILLIMITILVIYTALPIYGVIVNFSGDIYTVHVPVNVEVLEIKLVLETGEDGSVIKISSLEMIRVETTPPSQPEEPEDADRTDPKEPVQPDDGTVEPDEPQQPDAGEGVPTGGGIGGGSSGGGGAGGTPNPEPFSFEVYENGNGASFGHATTAQVNIFGVNKRIAPGMKGSYRFTVDNTQNSYRTLYTLDFTERDTLPAGSKIPMVFRLKEGNSYVAGDADTWLRADQLYQDTVIAGNGKLAYTLEWHWQPGGAEKDNLYTEFSRNEDYSYTLSIKITAQRE